MSIHDFTYGEWLAERDQALLNVEIPSELRQELRDVISSFIGGSRSLEEVRFWIVDHWQELADSNDDVAVEVAQKTMMLIYEHSYHWLNKATVREAVYHVLKDYRLHRANDLY